MPHPTNKPRGLPLSSLTMLGDLATVRAVSPFSSTAVTSAPLAIRYLAASLCPPLACRDNVQCTMHHWWKLVMIILCIISSHWHLLAGNCLALPRSVLEPVKCPCSTFQGVDITASIQTYGNYIPGKRPYGPNRECLLGTLRYLQTNSMIVSQGVQCPNMQVRFSA